MTENNVNPAAVPAHVRMPDTVTLPIEDITPYFNNPRNIPQEAVDALQTSIQNYGYLQPIIVDEEHVVVVGHTRLQALKQMGVTEVPVIVTTLPEDKVREYRLVDNRTSELTSWDSSSLVSELRRMEQEILDQFFPDFDLEIEALSDQSVTNQDVANAVEEVSRVREPQIVHTTDVTCPACFHTFQVSTRSLPGGDDYLDSLV